MRCSWRLATAMRIACLFPAALIGAAVLQACNDDRSAARGRLDTSAVASQGSAASSARATAPRDSIAAVQTQWTVAEVLDRLRGDGMPAQLGGEVRQPFLAVPGVLVTIAGAEIQLYLYGDAGAAGRDVARLDTNRVAPANMTITWIAPPSLIWHNNMVAIVITRDAPLRARIARSLEPGAHESVPAQP